MCSLMDLSSSWFLNDIEVALISSSPEDGLVLLDCSNVTEPFLKLDLIALDFGLNMTLAASISDFLGACLTVLAIANGMS
jgi:hypothetical protein